MVWSFDAWTPDDTPAEIIEIGSGKDLEDLEHRYTDGNGNGPLHRVLEVVSDNGVKTVVVERRYIDVDWRSQHAAFYSGTFRRYPSITHRLHFFDKPFPAQLAEAVDLQKAYLGYSIMRPNPLCPVGRTMVTPPRQLADAVRCEAEESIDLFGRELTVRAMPFISQDAEYLRCAHAAIWMVLHLAHLAHGLPRRLPADIHESARGGVIVDRQLPSQGLSVPQMLQCMSALGLSPGRRTLPTSAATGEDLTGLYASVCRYVNSLLPPVVVSLTHAWVVIAYQRQPSPGHGKLTLWRHDDARGPYLRVEDPYNELSPDHQPWAQLLPALLPKLYVDAERAETVGRYWTDMWLRSSIGQGTQVEALFKTDQLAYRTYAVRASSYKQGLKKSGIPTALMDAYRLTPMPRYVWVIELVDRQARANRQPDVVGEVILDPTVSQYLPSSDGGLITVHIDTFSLTYGPDHRSPRQISLEPSPPYASGSPLR